MTDKQPGTGAVVLLFGSRRAPRPLNRLTALRVAAPGDLAAAVEGYRRVVVVGTDADLAIVLTRLLRSDRLDVEVGFAAGRPSAATRAYRLHTGWRGARQAGFGAAQRVPLIRDDTGQALAGAALWLGDGGVLSGEAIVDDTGLFDGQAGGVRIEPTLAAPGLRARLLPSVTNRGEERVHRGVWPVPKRWMSGRAAQLGTPGAQLVRDGVPAPRPVRRSTFYRHITGWLAVR